MDNSVSNCIIGDDVNTDISRIYSGNTISLQKFVITKGNFSLALSTVDNFVQHTNMGGGVNNSTSLTLYRALYKINDINFFNTGI